jgi:phage-related tail protein
MRGWRLAAFVVGALWFSAIGAQAQTQSSGDASATAAPPAAAQESAGAQNVLTPEQIDELQAMVARMQSAMQDMVSSARSTAGRLASGGQTVVLSTNEIAAIALGAAGGAVLVDLLGGGGLATMAGAVIGGVAAHWLITAPPATATAGAG